MPASVPVALAHRPEVALSKQHQPQDPKQPDNQPSIPGAIESLEKIPDELKPFYALDEKSGKYIARVNGYYVPSSRLVEFRENNNEFKRQIADNEAAMAIYRSLNEDPKALEAEVRARRRAQWREDNREAMAAYNARIARNGLAGDRVRAFKASLKDAAGE